MTTTLTTPITVPLTKLVLWEGNVRKTDPEAGIGELSATIASHGLLHSLVLKKDRRGKYAVVAGGRRFRALQSLAEKGMIAKNAAVPCILIDDDVNPTEISLVENVHREPMHPADEFGCF
jgi:ParB family chromosome partitioning protein